MSFLIIILLTLLLSAFFSGMEIAFLSANKLKIEIEKKQGVFSAKFISFFQDHSTQYIATMLIGKNLSIVAFTVCLTSLLSPAQLSFVSNKWILLIISVLVSFSIIFFTSEIFSKALFRINPNKELSALAFPVFIFYLLLSPLSIFGIGFSKLLLKVFKFSNKTKAAPYIFGKIELENLINETESSNKEDQIQDHEIKIFRNALDFSKVKIRDCMVPRAEIVAIEEDADIEELRRLFIESGYSKILIYKNNIDNVVGYISSKELFKHPQSIHSKSIRPIFVPESMNANKLLHLLLQEHKSIAVVIDEFGGTSGLISIEDIIEEIFGDIEDEHDTDNLIEKSLPNGEYVFSGRLEIEYLNEKYALNIAESDDYQTLAGYIINHLGRIPKANEVCNIPKYKANMLKVSNTRIELVKLVPD
jgi:CBS domain containing-hemolysin-like protein